MSRHFNEERIVLSTKGTWVTRNPHAQKWPLPHTMYQKINSKWVLDQKVRVKTTKVLKENLGANLCSLGLGNGFLDVTPKTQATKEK